jgi:hypothetical protein
LFKQIDGSRVQLAGFSSANLEQVVVGKSNAETDEKSETAVEEFFDGTRFAAGNWRVIIGNYSVAPVPIALL